MDTVLKPLGVTCSGVFLDLGISSPQFDDESRGFRPEQDGPLDLRFDVTQGVPASEFLERVDRDELVRILHEYARPRTRSRRGGSPTRCASPWRRKGFLRRPRLSPRSWLPPRVRNTRRCTRRS